MSWRLCRCADPFPLCARQKIDPFPQSITSALLPLNRPIAAKELGEQLELEVIWRLSHPCWPGYQKDHVNGPEGMARPCDKPVEGATRRPLIEEVRETGIGLQLSRAPQLRIHLPATMANTSVVLLRQNLPNLSSFTFLLEVCTIVNGLEPPLETYQFVPSAQKMSA